SAVILEKLAADGHDIHVVVSGRAHDYLSKRLPNVRRIWGLTMVMEDNAVKKLVTAAGNLKGALEGWPKNVRSYFEVVREFSPDVVISDFESWTWLFAKIHRIPLICIDNIQILNRCWHEDAIIGGDMRDFLLAKSLVKAKCPKAAHYLVSTFFYPEVRKKRTTLVPPILRRGILDAAPSQGDHLLVYQTSESFPGLPGMLEKLDRPARIYGLRRDIVEDVQEGNLLFRPFSEEGFIADLASSAGVVASAGFTLLGEALHLRKPFLATPVGKQFEQLLNSRYLEELGYGMYDEDLDMDALRRFDTHLPRYGAALKSYEPRDNDALFTALDELLDKREARLL
ncbi:MAG: glycosyltransferase family protein, partial [Bradymonadaceae bacterium]